MARRPSSLKRSIAGARYTNERLRSQSKKRGHLMSTWIDACAVDDVDEEDLITWEHGGKLYAI